MTADAARSPSLNAARRAAELARLASGEPVDVLVIGGGITGTGVALDAASRGLRVALVERRDLASGTSRWSSKLVHGGLRYLRHLQVGIAWESAVERHLLMTRVAPHLVRPVPFVIPLNERITPRHGALTEMGIRGGDLLRVAAGTPGAVLPAPRRIQGAEALSLAPGLNPGGLRGALLLWDGQLEDDARLVVAVARTAARHGAAVLTYCEAQIADRGRVACRDVVSGQGFEVRATHVVNAAGVWAERLAPSVRLRPSKGSHLIVAADALDRPRASVMVPVPRASARWVGATPASDGRVIIGLTDDAYTGDLVDDLPVTDAERDFLLSTLNPALRRPLHVADIIGSYAGLRPLLAGADEATADLSRRHAIVDDPDTGTVAVVGGKLTTYRRMAEETVDHLLRSAPRPCRTRGLPLVGAAPARLLRGLDGPSRLVRRYGAEAPLVAALAHEDPALLEPLAPGVDALGAEVLFAYRHEGALTLSDVLDRRLRLGLVPEERRAAEPVAAALLQGLAA